MGKDSVPIPNSETYEKMRQYLKCAKLSKKNILHNCSAML